ncbi:MAG: hypothetical protein WC483_01555 [Candidatus Paceibacterota bacterium]
MVKPLRGSAEPKPIMSFPASLRVAGAKGNKNRTRKPMNSTEVARFPPPALK